MGVKVKVKKQKKAYTFTASVVPEVENGVVDSYGAIKKAAHELIDVLPFWSLVSLFKCDLLADKMVVRVYDASHKSVAHETLYEESKTGGVDVLE